MVKNMLTFIAYCVIAGALIFLTRASEMPLKALVGQYLLDDVWKKTLHSGTQTKPWASADFKVIGELKVPRLGVSRIVLNTASGEAMAWGVGQIDSIPMASNFSPIILAGHRDSHMKFMSKLRIGDQLDFQLADGSSQSYKITKSIILSKPEFHLIDKLVDHPQLILTTCWPFNATRPGPERLIMIGNLV